jgi:hypothetical protein
MPSIMLSMKACSAQTCWIAPRGKSSTAGTHRDWQQQVASRMARLISIAGPGGGVVRRLTMQLHQCAGRCAGGSLGTLSCA